MGKTDLEDEEEYSLEDTNKNDETLISKRTTMPIDPRQAHHLHQHGIQQASCDDPLNNNDDRDSDNEEGHLLIGGD